MPLVQTWRCDSCLKDSQEPDPIGWLLKGHRLPSRAQQIPMDLYLCSNGCAAEFFRNYAQTYKE